MFSIKYLLFEATEKYNLEKVRDYGDITLYRNPYIWPLAIKADRSVAQMDMAEVTRGLLAQELLEGAWDISLSPVNTIPYETAAVNTEISTTADGLLCIDPMDNEEERLVTFTFTAPEDTNIYMNLVTENRGVVKRISCKDTEIKRYPGYYDHGVRYLCPAVKGEEITVTFEMKETLYADELMFIYDDRSQLDEMNRYMEMNSYRDSGFDGDSFTVRGTMDDTRGMLLMIPYNKGWTIKVNGTATPYLPVVENFVFVDVPQGDFVMEVSYFPPKLLLGAAVSAAVLCICLAYLVIEKKKLLR